MADVSSPVSGTRAFVYCRLSRDGDGLALGVERQLADCLALAAHHGFVVVEQFVENDTGASSRSRKARPKYADMLRRVQAGEAAAVVCYSSSRLTRRPREFEDWLDLADTGQVSVVTVTAGAGQADLSTAQGRMVGRILAAADALESEQLSERARRERAQRRAAGRWVGGQRPFGWEPDGMTIRPLEAELVIQAAHDILAGRSLRSIAADWATATGRSQHRSRVREVLLNPRVVARGRDGQATNWPALLDEATFVGVRSVLTDPTRRHPRGASRLLTGIGTCALCAATLHGSVTGGGHPAYRCSKARHLDRRSGPVDQFVTAVLMGRLAQEELRAAPGPGTVAHGDPGAIRGRLDDAALQGVPLDATALTEWWAEADMDHRRAVLRAAEMTITVAPAGRGRKAFDPATVVIGWLG